MKNLLYILVTFCGSAVALYATKSAIKAQIDELTPTETAENSDVQSGIIADLFFMSSDSQNV